MRSLYLKPILLALLLSLSAIVSQAQDIHFSHYYSFPMAVNPALAGNFDGTFRIGAIYRSQWHKLIDQDAFQTPGAFVDIPFLEGVLKRDKFGAGLSFYNDIVGPGWNNMHASLSLAYHKGIGREAQHRFSLGAQVEFVQWRLNPNNITFMDQFNSDQFAATLPTFENIANDNLNYANYNFGLYWKTRAIKRVAVQAGFSVFNIAEPEEAVLLSSGPSDALTRPTRYLGDLGVDIRVGDRYHIAPDAFYSKQGGSDEITIGTSFGVDFNDGFRNRNSLYVGARYRLDDAVIAMASVEVKNLRIGFAYDVTVSDLAESNNNRGAYEISIVYIGESIKSFKVNKSLPCRRF